MTWPASVEPGGSTEEEYRDIHVQLCRLCTAQLWGLHPTDPIFNRTPGNFECEEACETSEQAPRCQIQV